MVEEDAGDVNVANARGDPERPRGQCTRRPRAGSRSRRRRARGSGHAAGCRHDSWLPSCREDRGLSSGRALARGRRGGCRSTSVHPEKGCGAEHVCCSPRCRLGSGKTSEAAKGALSGGKGWRRGGICLVVSRPGARRAPAASGSTEEWFLAGATPFGLKGAGEAWGGSEPVVASIGLTEGKGGRSSEPIRSHGAGW